MARMGHELENPSVIGDYYEPSKMLPDTDENRMAYVREKHLGWRAAAIGMNVQKFSQEPQKDLMEVIWDMIEQDQPDRAMEWACGLVECSPYYDSYTDWRCEPCMEPLPRRVTA